MHFVFILLVSIDSKFSFKHPKIGRRKTVCLLFYYQIFNFSLTAIHLVFIYLLKTVITIKVNTYLFLICKTALIQLKTTRRMKQNTTDYVGATCSHSNHIILLHLPYFIYLYKILYNKINIQTHWNCDKKIIKNNIVYVHIIRIWFIRKTNYTSLHKRKMKCTNYSHLYVCITLTIHKIKQNKNNTCSRFMWIKIQGHTASPLPSTANHQHTYIQWLF